MTVKNMKKGIGAVAGLAMVAALFATAPAAYATDDDNTAANGYVAEVTRADNGYEIGKFSDLKQAFDAAWDSRATTITLLADVNIADAANSTPYTNNKTVTLNLNGYDITASAQRAALAVMGTGNLTIVGNGTIAGGPAVQLDGVTSKLTIDGGTFDGLKTTSWTNNEGEEESSAYAIKINEAAGSSADQVTINGGTFKSTGEATYHYLLDQANDDSKYKRYSVTGGTFKGDNFTNPGAANPYNGDDQGDVSFLADGYQSVSAANDSKTFVVVPATSSFLSYTGASLRVKEGEDAATSTSLRFRYKLTEPAGFTGYDWGWNYGLGSTGKLPVSVSATNRTALAGDDEGWYSSSLVIPGISAKNYGVQFISQFHVTFTTPEGTPVKLVDNVRWSSVADLANKILASKDNSQQAQKDKAYAQKLIDAYNAVKQTK